MAAELPGAQRLKTVLRILFSLLEMGGKCGRDTPAKFDPRQALIVNEASSNTNAQ
jgi:hypothetical protein